MIITAILVDGSYFIKRFRTIYHKTKDDFNPYDAQFMAKEFYTIALRHLNKNRHKRSDNQDDYENEILYRILYYDCPPLNKRGHNPVSKKAITKNRQLYWY